MVVAGLWCAIVSAQAQGASGNRAVEGRVRRPGTAAPAPVPGLMVVLHRVGTDRAGPLDSMRSGRDGRYRFRYVRTGQDDALYFVSATYLGIAYFSTPLRDAAVHAGDADLLVYDTTADASALRVQGRHLVVSAPRGTKREIAEIF